MTKLLNFIKKFYLFLIFVFLYAPVVVLMIFSFNESKSRATWTGFTFKWYGHLFQDENIMNALYTTIIIAVLSALIATVVGTFSAIGIENFNKKMKKTVLTVTNIPIVSPDIVTGASLMMLFIFSFSVLQFGQLGFTTLLLAHISFNIPYVILAVTPRLKQIDKNLFEAALDLGATPTTAFFKVLLPEIMPGVVSGFLIAFTMSVDDFVISFFTAGQGINNLSTIIYSMSKKGINPEINALSTLMFIVVLTLLYIINIRTNKMNKSEE